MAQVGNSEDRFGGEYMIQDNDHMGNVGKAQRIARTDRAHQSEQSGSSSRQQGGDHQDSGQQGGERRARKSR
jgi:hypothetical protein